jgi:hypothetical protein
MTLTAMYGLLHDATLAQDKRLNTRHTVFY